MRIRPATDADGHDFAYFTCSHGPKDEATVEAFIRNDALFWLVEGSGRYVSVLEDNDLLLAACAYEHDPGAEYEWFIKCLGVKLSAQDLKYGKTLLQTCLNRMRAFTPGAAAFWKVNAGNAPSCAMSERVGGVADPSPNNPELLIYSVVF